MATTRTKNEKPEEEPAAQGELVSFLTRDEILGLDDRLFETVEVPEWRQSKEGPIPLVRVRGLTGTERDSWEASLLREEGTGRKARAKMDYSDLRSKLIVRSVVDGEGNRQFTDADVRALGRKSAAALQRIFEVCQRLSRLTDEDVDELVGNSDGTRNGDTGST